MKLQNYSITAAKENLKVFFTDVQVILTESFPKYKKNLHNYKNKCFILLQFFIFYHINSEN